MKDLIYLASPYSDPSPLIRHTRFLEACSAAAFLFQRGYLVFSPIAHTHPIKELSTMSGNWESWQEYDEIMLSRCDALRVLCIPGWKGSVGVQKEVELARWSLMPVQYMRKEKEGEYSFSKEEVTD